MVEKLTAWSLRRLAARPETWGKMPHIGDRMTPAQTAKVRAAMKDMAERLDPKDTEVIDVEPRKPATIEGEKPDEAA
jgi:hypothetical protein